MSNSHLTPRQSLVYEFIKDYISTNNCSPFIREIQEGCAISSYKSTVDRLLALEKKGLIKREANKHRGICLNGQTI